MMASGDGGRTAWPATIGVLAATIALLATPCAAQAVAVRDDPAATGRTHADPTLDLPAGLEAHGLDIDLLYIGESFAARRLVPGDAVHYRGNVNLHIGLDAAAVGWWTGGELFLDLENGHGRGFALVQDGVSQFLTDIDSPDFTQIYQWGVEQRFAGKRLRLRLGKQDTNDILAVNSLGADFISPPYTLIPTVPLPTFPAPALGAALFIEPEAAVTVGMGFFDGGSRIGGLGFDTFLDGAGGYFSFLEPVLRVRAGAGQGLPGTYRVGIWYHSGPFPATDRQGRELTGNHGAFLVLDQLLSPPAEDGQQRGAGVFLQLGWAPADRNPMSRYLGIGLKWVGLLPGRDDDFLGVGAAATQWNLFDPPGARRRVYNLELFYMARLSSWASLQPDLQVFSAGSGRAARPWAVGLRWLIELR